MGCRQTKDNEDNLTILPLFNMLVVGFSQSGKTSILSKLNGQQISSRYTLDINTIIINKSLKLMTFQVSGKAEKTWKNYYQNADIVMFVIDVNQFNTDKNNRNSTKIIQKLKQIDQNVKNTCKILIVVNKVDLLQNKTRNTNINQQLNLKKFTSTSTSSSISPSKFNNKNTVIKNKKQLIQTQEIATASMINQQQSDLSISIQPYLKQLNLSKIISHSFQTVGFCGLSGIGVKILTKKLQNILLSSLTKT